MLQHILKNKEGRKCAVIVNDMASINIDATVLKNNHLVQVMAYLEQSLLHRVVINKRSAKVDLLLAPASANFLSPVVCSSTGSIDGPMKMLFNDACDTELSVSSAHCLGAQFLHESGTFLGLHQSLNSRLASATDPPITCDNWT